MDRESGREEADEEEEAEGEDEEESTEEGTEAEKGQGGRGVVGQQQRLSTIRRGQSNTIPNQAEGEQRDRD